MVVPASISENACVERILTELRRAGQDERLEPVLVDRGVSAHAAKRLSKTFDVEVRLVGWGNPQLDKNGRRCSGRSPTIGGSRCRNGNLGWSRGLAKSFENTTASVTGWLHLAAMRAVLAGLG